MRSGGVSPSTEIAAATVDGKIKAQHWTRHCLGLVRHLSNKSVRQQHSYGRTGPWDDSPALGSNGSAGLLSKAHINTSDTKEEKNAGPSAVF